MAGKTATPGHALCLHRSLFTHHTTFASRKHRPSSGLWATLNSSSASSSAGTGGHLVSLSAKHHLSLERAWHVKRARCALYGQLKFPWHKSTSEIEFELSGH